MGTALENTACLLALDVLVKQVHGLGVQGFHRLLKAASSPEMLWQAPELFLKQHLPVKQLEAWFSMKSGMDPNALAARYAAASIDWLAISDPDYPVLLKEIYDPPPLLYLCGDRKALTGNTLAFVGTRRASDYGKRMTEKLIAETAGANPVIISGLAAGIDGEAHRQALQQGLKTVAVFGCGIDIVFPTHHQGLARDILAAGGACISEYPMGMPGSKYTFPERNRIIAGLSEGVVVVEGPMTSGALITARAALSENRLVFAVPRDAFHPNAAGPLSLIRQGAVCTTEGSHILEEFPQWETAQLPLSLEKSLPDTLSDDERLLMSLLQETEMPVAFDALQTQSGFSAPQLNQVLTLLELQGLLKSCPGNRYVRCV